MYLKIVFCTSLLCALVSSSTAQKLKVMSYNIHHGRNISGEIDLNGIAEVIIRSGAEIIGLQEVDSLCHRSGDVDQMKVLASLTGMHYTFRRHFAYDGGSYGLGILSKYPISGVNGHRISSYSADDKPKTLVFLTADIDVQSRETVRFGTVHFDYRKDPVVRLRQAKDVTNILQNVKEPIILTGDLNAEPDKQEIGKLYERFADADTSGAFTFPADAPVKKIDYILVSTLNLKKVVNHEVIESIASDHRPVTALIKLKK